MTIRSWGFVTGESDTYTSGKTDGAANIGRIHSFSLSSRAKLAVDVCLDRLRDLSHNRAHNAARRRQ